LFWDDNITTIAAFAALADAENFIANEKEELQKKTHLAKIFDFPQLLKSGNEIVEEMNQELTEMKTLWTVIKSLKQFIHDSKAILWSQMSTDELEDGSKAQVKAVKNLHKCTRWSKAYKYADKLSKDFLNTIPLISLLGGKCMRERHWETLQVITKKDFTAPYANPSLLLGEILELNLHEFSADVEEICDQAAKELKIELTLAQIVQRWASITWNMEPYKDTDVPLLKLTEEDFESLESDQLTVQSMLASRFVKQFDVETQNVSV
jgi:dynein heavy chain